MKVLELFSGTHSIGKVCKKKGFEVVSLDRDLGGKCPFGTDYESDIHIKEDIMTWDYKKDFKIGEFDLITASPVCLWWSVLRNSWIGRKLKGMDRPLTKEDIENDIAKYGEPMVDKVFEIIEYFNPRFWWIENPQSSTMKNYINELIPFYDVDYCKYTDWGYKKKTRIWTNIEGFIPKLCLNDCENIVKMESQYLHKDRIGSNKSINDNGKIIRVNTAELRRKYKNFKPVELLRGKSNRLERYRIPEKLIEDLLMNIIQDTEI